MLIVHNCVQLLAVSSSKYWYCKCFTVGKRTVLRRKKRNCSLCKLRNLFCLFYIASRNVLVLSPFPFFPSGLCLVKYTERHSFTSVFCTELQPKECGRHGKEATSFEQFWVYCNWSPKKCLFFIMVVT